MFNKYLLTSDCSKEVVCPPVAALLFFLTIICGLWLAQKIVPFQVDDAFITYRYAANLAQGHMFQYNVEGPIVEGFSSPFWLLVLAILAKPFGTAPIPFVSYLLGLASYVLLFIVTWQIISSIERIDGVQKNKGWSLLLSGSLLALFPGMIFYAVTGLETIFFVLIVLIYAGAAVKLLPLSLGMAAGFLSLWVRPEGGWFPVMLVVQLIASGRIKDILTKNSLFLIGSVVISGISLLCFRYVLFNELLPNTYYAKIPSLFAGLEYVYRSFATKHGLLIVVLGLLGALFGKSIHRGFLGVAASWVVAVILEGGDWMIESRMLLPAFAALSVAATGIVVPSLRNAWRFVNNAILACVFLASCVLLISANVYLVEQTKLYEATKNKEALLVANWINRSGAKSAGLVDIGEIGYKTGVEIFDFGGLTDSEIGKSPGPHLGKRYNLGYLFENRRPDVIILRTDRLPRKYLNERPVYSFEDLMSGTEQFVMLDSRFKKYYDLAFSIHPGYRRSPNHYGLLVYQRHDFIPRPEVAALFPSSLSSESKMLFTKPPDKTEYKF